MPKHTGIRARRHPSRLNDWNPCGNPGCPDKGPGKYCCPQCQSAAKAKAKAKAAAAQSEILKS